MNMGIYMKTTLVRECLECGDKIVYGREGRKFCSETCKNKYHNDRQHRKRAVQVKVITALAQNYRVLESLIAAGVTSMGLMEIVRMGFNDEYATSYRRIKGRDVLRCFDIQYCQTPSRIMKITRVDLNDKIRLF